MENTQNKLNLIKEEDFILFRSEHICTTISKIKEKHFFLSKGFKISINFFNKISKEKTFVELQINKKLFELVFDYKFLSSETKKESKRQFSNNLLNEILENFLPIVEMKFYSDNLNFTSPNTLKNITKNFMSNHKLKKLELSNYVFDSIFTDFEYLNKVKNMHFDNILLIFSYDKFDLNLLTDILDNIVARNTKKVNLTFLFKYLDIESFEQTNISANNKYFLNDFTLNLIKFNAQQNDLKIEIVPKCIMEYFWPGFLEVNYSEIIQSQVKSEIKYFFRKYNIKYTKQQFFFLNVIKDLIFSQKIKKHTNKLTQIMSLCSKFAINNENIFKFSSQIFDFPNFQKINLIKSIFYLIQEYDSQNFRKITTEQIKDKLYIKTSSHLCFLKEFEKFSLKKNDLNTASRILNQIEGFSKVHMNNGDKYFIGGRMKTNENNKEEMVILNSILIFSNDYSNLCIRNLNEKVLLPHFNASAIMLGESKIVICGGLTILTFREEFLKTPIFVLDSKSYEVKRFFPEGSVFPGLIFNHKIKIIKENRILIYDGYILSSSENNSNSLKVRRYQPNVSKNISFFEFDFLSSRWNLTVCGLKI